jgi:phage shock protein PspC (stress-responsive transcriptional regulator)
MSKPTKTRMRMPGAARTGIGLLVVGGIVSGLGQYYQRDAMALYGLVIVACGFVLYMASSIYAKRTARR